VVVSNIFPLCFSYRNLTSLSSEQKPTVLLRGLSPHVTLALWRWVRTAHCVLHGRVLLHEVDIPAMTLPARGFLNCCGSRASPGRDREQTAKKRAEEGQGVKKA